ncbi:MAG: Eco57I restriction-modification methylase domain-containing protein [Planctomycetota bacterium]|nr:Eco57I restriction-modification methylase domain-containing protein [Planctomycetota bacterium]
MDAAGVQIIDQRRCAIQDAYDGKQGMVARNKQGQFATPPQLSYEIAQYISTLLGPSGEPIHFFEPAIGTGSFFSALLRTFPRERIGSATGVEIDCELARMGRELWGEFGLRVLEGDFTKMPRESFVPSPNLILTNPPYIRHHHLAREQKLRLQELAWRVAGVEVNGLAGFYVYYLLLASELLARGGLAAWLIPSEFMDVNYGEVLRRYLSEKVTLLRIHRFDPNEVQFDDALVSSAVVLFRKAPAQEDGVAQFTYGGTLTNPKVAQEVPCRSLSRTAKWTQFPHSPDRTGQTRDSHTGNLLEDLFRIQRGIATGANDVFILRREEARRLGLPEEFLRPVLPSPRAFKTVVVERGQDGHPMIEDQLVMVDCDLPEHLVRARFPTLWDYLKNAAKNGVREGYLVSKRNPWYKQEHREPSPFLCTYMGRGAGDARPFRFILNRSDAVATNLYLLLYPRAPLARMLEKRSELAEGLFHAMCGITGHDLRSEGRVYGGGLHKIEPKELGRVSAERILGALPELRDVIRDRRREQEFGDAGGGLFGPQ